MKKNPVSWMVHLAVRLIAAPLLFAIIYLLILNGRSDPMGIGIAYALIVLLIAGILYLGIEAIVLYRNKQWDKLCCNILLLAIPLYSIPGFLNAR
ncbi:hypothetical protein [Taibaiella koreensis]|uniref:hypothetical protein n=1 Tax=Taibaiella koreensis TaxID=1268548 RepID=UPI000E59B22E|nr:hypothetical protein [Taibaiella koreensis]